MTDVEVDVDPAPPPPPGDVPYRHRGRRRPLAWLAVGCAAAVALGLVLFVGIGKGGSGPASSDVAPGIDRPAASMLSLNVLPAGTGSRPPDFTLTDQHGSSVSLRQFRGKVVVLSFNDDRCPDLCTLLAQDIVVANRDLGPMARRVVFLAVNVNPFYPEVRYVSTWTDSHGLGGQPNWVFTTGPVASLKAVWKDYGTEVQPTDKTRTVAHSTDMFFIDPQGRERAVGSFGTKAANTSLYAHDLAQMAADLLPASERSTVKGPVTPAPSSSDATVGARAPGFDLPLLGRPGQKVSLAGLRGRYVVLNFWASTCTACVAEMPHVEEAYRALGSQVAFVGIDVSATGSGAAFATQEGVTYPLVADASGSVAGKYQVSGLPFTVVVGPGGAVKIRHPGSITTEQLVYILRNHP